MMRLAACLALASVASIALGTALVAVALRRLRWSPAPRRCPVCGELVERHTAPVRTTWQPGGVDA